MTGFLIGFFWGVFWFLIGGGLIGLLLTLWVVFRVLVWADTQPDDIEDVPRTIDCRHCGGLAMLRLGPFVDHRDEEYECGSCGRVTYGHG